jgi:hypothetical protein
VSQPIELVASDDSLTDMTADAMIKQIALTTIVLGWPAIVIVYVLAGMSPILDWSVVVLIGMTVGLAGRWLGDWCAK